MESRTVSCRVNNKILTYRVEGNFIYGPDCVLLDRDDDLLDGLSWHKSGYALFPFIDQNFREKFRSYIHEKIIENLRALGVSVPANFQLENYHQHVDDNLHQEFCKLSYGSLLYEQTYMDEISEFVSGVCDKKVQVTTDKILLRVIRPSSPDYNPLHKDVWLDRLRHGINLFIPIAGCTQDSSLAVVPGSHLWSEAEILRTDEGAIVDGKPFSVPAYAAAAHDFSAIVPNPGPDEILIFTPYLLHGLGANFSNKSTRISIELRLRRS